MKKILFILFFTIPFVGFGQGWVQTYGGSSNEYGKSVQQTTDGGYIISGFIEYLTGVQETYLIKTDVNGLQQWDKSYGGISYDRSSCVQQTTDGGYISCGYKEVSSIGYRSVYLIKTDLQGDSLWTRTYMNGPGNDWNYGKFVQQTTDGGYIICGFTNPDIFGNGNYDVYLIKTDGNGVEQWSKTYGGISDDEGYSVQQTTDGGYIICGETESFGNGNDDFYLIKTDGNGVEQWNQTYGGSITDRGRSVKQTTDGGYIICGETESFGNGNKDVYLIKTDNNGIEQWNQTFGGSGNDEGEWVQQTTDGGYIICGETGGTNLFLTKTDNNGIVQWDQTYLNVTGQSVQQTTDGGFIIGGHGIGSVVNGFGHDIYLIKTDGNGNITSTLNIPINPNRKLEKVVDILGRETKPQTNTPFIEIYDDGSTEKKIVIE